MQSTMADVDGDTELNTTDSGPWSAASAWSRSVTICNASSHEIRCQSGSDAPFGAVRLRGCRKRSGWLVISGAAFPLTHSAFPVGCRGSRDSANVSSVTVARAPHRDTHKGQKVATSVLTAPSTTMGTPLVPLCQRTGTG